ncbi:MAG: hypothetical protein HWE39_14000 [Oceanospirillaceae bacterium]|nr:hypothetical protein [Oceanospirillaceae bacterium]
MNGTTRSSQKLIAALRTLAGQAIIGQRKVIERFLIVRLDNSKRDALLSMARTAIRRRHVEVGARVQAH